MKTFREKVEATPTYKSLEPIQKESTLNRSTLKQLEDGFTIATNIGFQKWKTQSGLTERNIRIVYDLLNALPSEPVIENLKVSAVLTVVPLQVYELIKIHSFNEYREFIQKVEQKGKLLAVNQSGHLIRDMHLLNDNNYPFTIYEATEPAVEKVPYHSLSNN
ncbi:MAG: hypothetical protein J0M25_00790 [Flavobacteriales bacterium]|nr:hypothetical protein [Flavobacteriales bacterium]